MTTLKDTFLKQLQTISKLEMMQALTPFLYGEDALMLNLFLNETTTPKSMANTLNITKGRVTAIMNSLKKKEYIKVMPNQFDGRSIELVLTNKGISYIQQKLDFIDNYFEQLLTHIGEEQSKALVDLLDILLRKVEKFEVKNHG